MFMIIFMIALFKYKNEIMNKKKSLLFLSVLAILIMQGSETYMVFMTVFILMFMLLELIFYNRIDRWHILLLIVIASVAVFVLTSPGIYVREVAFPGSILPEAQSFFKQITLALRISFAGVLSFILNKALIIFLSSMALLSTFDLLFHKNKHFINHSLPTLHPIIALLIMIILPMAIFFPSCWLSGTLPADGRVPNTAYFYFLLGWMYLLVCTLTFVKKKYDINFNCKINKKIQWIFAGVILLALFLQNNIRAAYGDLLLGRAYAFDKQLTDRYEMIENCKNDTCFVAPLNVNLASIWYSDLTTDASDNNNINYSIFFGKKAICMTEK